jgi:hypothetical protein
MKTFRFILLSTLLAGTVTLAQTNPVPLVNQPTVPTATAPGGPSFTLTVHGTGFVSGSVINWNATALATTFISSSELSTTVPTSDIAKQSTATITVTSPGPGGGMSNPLFFSVCPKVSSLAFVVSQALATDNNPVSGVVGDFNGDGKLDLAVFGTDSRTSSTVSVFLGNGDGTFQPGVAYPALIPVNNGGDLITADLNGDGKLDLAVEIPGEVSVFLGNGDGTFQPRVDYPGDPNSFSRIGLGLVAGDFNRDGKLDLAAGWADLTVGGGGTSTGGASIYLGNGDGTFQPYVNTPQGDGAVWLALGDLNDDGNLDLALVSTSGSVANSETLLGNGDGTFSIGGYLPGFSEPLFIAFADLNGDAKLDATVGQRPIYPPLDYLGVMLGNGDGTFQQSFSPLIIGTPFVIGDFDGDGNLDLADGQSFLLGDGKGGFSQANVPPTGCQSPALAIGDFNGDGRLDVVAFANKANTICVALQSVPDFTIGPASGQSTSATVNAGQSAMFNLAVTPSSSFSGTVDLSCAITPSVTPAPTCSVPSSMNVKAGTAMPVQAMVSTTAAMTAGTVSSDEFPPKAIPFAWSVMLFVPGLILLRNRRRLQVLASSSAVLSIILFVGCGGGGSGSSHTTPGTPSGTYTVTVTATSGSLQHSTTLTVVVQ